MSNSDLGIVLFASGDGSGSFSNRDGTPGVVRTLTNANFIASDWFDVGRLAELLISISGVVSAQMASAVVMLERRRTDEKNPLFVYSPAVIGTLRTDDPTAAKAAQQTITRNQLAGQTVSAWPNVAPAVEILDVVLATTDQRWAGQCRVLVKATNAVAPTDRVVISANGGG